MSDTGWHLKLLGPAGNDVTERFNALVAQAKAGNSAAVPADAKKYAYLLIPGLFTENYPGYMNDNINHMTALGLDVLKVGIDTDVGVAPNAAVIRDAILKVAGEKRQCVIIAHSKGGVDAATAIAQYDLYAHVRAFIALQVPYAGTPAVEVLLNSSGLEKIATTVITKVLKGCPTALADLSYEARRKEMKKTLLDTQRVVLVSFSSECGGSMSLMSPMALYLNKRFGVVTDGAVAPLDARFPGCDYVHVVGMDHGATVFGATGNMPKPGETMQAMIVLALERQVSTSKSLGDDDDDGDKKKKEKKDKKEKKAAKDDSGDEKKGKKDKKDKKDKKLDQSGKNQK